MEPLPEDFFREWADETMSYFAYGHLPPKLQEVSKAFADLAHLVYHQGTGFSRQKCMALDMLVYGKDAAVRDMVNYLKGKGNGM